MDAAEVSGVVVFAVDKNYKITPPKGESNIMSSRSGIGGRFCKVSKYLTIPANGKRSDFNMEMSYTPHHKTYFGEY